MLKTFWGWGWRNIHVCRYGVLVDFEGILDDRNLSI